MGMGNLNSLVTLLEVRGRLVVEEHLVYTSGADTIFSFSLSCCYGSRLSKKASTHSFKFAVFAEQILGEWNFSCLVILCFPDTLKLQFGICTIIAGSCWHLSEAHSMDCHISHSCWLQPLSSVAAMMGSGIILKVRPLIDRCLFSPNPLCLQRERGVKDNIQVIQTDLPNGVFLP